MKTFFKYYLILIPFLFGSKVYSQNQAAKWYFGQYAGLDFMQNPPTVLTGTLNTLEGCASISDPNGNLLFYTDGGTIYNQAHMVMANGTNLTGNFSTCQSAVILRQPGSPNLYFVFTLGAQGNAPLNYSIVDMSLAAGMGSVTVKNATLAVNCTEKLTAAKHCNGNDFWIVAHRDGNANDFLAFQVNSVGVNTTAVVSSVGQVGMQYRWGCHKISPNGKKLAAAVSGFQNSTVEVFDFDSSTGVVSNSLQIQNIPMGYGVEFSPDGTKLFVSGGNTLRQWDLCAGSDSAIIASQYSVSTVSSGQLQLAPNGKIYVAQFQTQFLGVINNPNVGGSGCNYVANALSIGPNTSLSGLPNFVTSFLKPPVPTFSCALNPNLCQTANFNWSIPQSSISNCFAGQFLTQSLTWNFGDPFSGPANTSTLNNPSHIFTSTGTYTVSLILYYSCGGGTDTLRQVVNISSPCLTLASNSITCANLGTATVTALGTGPYSYTWLPTGQNAAAANNLAPGNHSVMVFDGGRNATYTTTAVFTPSVPLTGSLSAASSVSCAGSQTASANIYNLAGGSGNQTYLWTNGINSFTQNPVTTLGAGQWSVTVTDALTACQVNSVFTISQPPALTLNLVANSQSVCIGNSIVLNGTNSGGTPGYSYSWNNGPANDTLVVAESSGGTYTYVLTSADANNCLIRDTISVDFVSNPVLSVTNALICPLQTGSITVSGASSYTWSTGSNNANISDNPLTTTIYTVTGEAQTCTSVATASIVLKPVPNALIGSNSPRCDGTNLNLFANGGSSYNWSGPSGFISAANNPVISPVSFGNAGIYNVTVTAANGCTASASGPVVVNANPTLSAVGSTVCTIQTASLNVSSVNGAGFLWTGPNNYSSAQQSPVWSNPSLNASGNYTVKVTSPQGCTNTANADLLVISPPVLTAPLSSNSLCAQAFNGSPNTITLTAGGASSYTLNTPAHILNTNPGGPSMPLGSAPPYTNSVSVSTATLFGSNGVCTVSTTVSFSVIPNPTLSILNPTPVICAGQSFTYHSAGANSFTWGPNTPGLTTYTSPVTVASPTVTSVYSVIGGSLGCNSPTETTTITVNPIPTISVTPSQTAVCMGNSATLKTSGTANSFTWMQFTFLNTQNGGEVITTPQTNITYTVTGSLNNCTNTAMASVDVLPLPKPKIKTSKSELCAGETLTLTGAGGEFYKWYGPNNVYLEGQSVNLNLGSYHYAGQYSLVATDSNACVNSTVTNIIIHPLPEGSLIGSQMEACVPFCSDFKFYSASSSASIITASWELNKKKFGSDFSYCFNKAGDHIVTGKFKDGNTGCLNTQTFVIHARPKPQADFTWLPEKPIENLDEVLFYNNTSGENQTHWNWYFTDNKGYRSQNENTSYLFKNAGIYPVAYIVKNNFGCIDSVVKVITIEPDFSVYVPNTFTPNDDDLNETFLPIVRGTKQYSFSIFNRWGEKLFETTDPKSGWDGYHNGVICKTDVYVWVIRLTTVHGESREYKGHVSLLR